jgi:dipeptidyl-peptidase-3
LKSYASTLEEGRADLVGLFYLYNKIQELGLVDDWKKQEWSLMTVILEMV